MPKIVLGVAGGVAAYKSISLARLLIDSGHEVVVVPTPSALNFVGKATWEAITGKPVHANVFEATDQVAHVAIARWADLVVVAPTTADLMFRAAAGAANDMLTAVLLTTTSPIIYFPAMHTEMWLNPATAANVATLRERGALVIDPATGPLARGDQGLGRLPEPDQMSALIASFLAKPDLVKDFAGKRALVTLGGTSESIDPIRLITNRSSGEMGAAICRALYLRGAEVTAIVGNHSAVLPHDIATRSITSATELAAEVTSLSPTHHLILMAAAVSDFTVSPATEKLTRGSSRTLELEPTEDILAKIVTLKKPDQFIVGFAAQTKDLLAAAKEKLERKKCDLIVANLVGNELGFGPVITEIQIVSKHGVVASGQVNKDQAAHLILDEIARNSIPS
jgi:phosphopantothenoylcysteine decarboxylase/phosphopantothenate--cysteine ligase